MLKVSRFLNNKNVVKVVIRSEGKEEKRLQNFSKIHFIKNLSLHFI